MSKFSYFISALLIAGFICLPFRQGANPYGNSLLSSQKESINRIVFNKIMEAEVAGNIDIFMEKFRVDNHLKGVSVAIVKDEKLVFAKGYGFADEKAGIQVTPNHLFRLASVSKLITAVAIMKLVENSKISLESKVFGKYGILSDEQFLHIKDKRLEKITVRHLLNHSGGWTQNYGDLAFLPRAVAKGIGESLPVNIDSYIKFVTTHKVHFEPGSRSSYSNLGYLILGKVISKVAGTDYETFVKKEVLEPSGIVDMNLGNSFEEQAFPNEVKYYQPADGEPVESFDGSGRILSKIYGGNDIHLLGSAGGWLASVTDLMKLMVVIDNNPKVKDILTPESIAEMTRVDPSGLDPLGWRATNENGEWWRTGTLPGTSALVKRQSNGISWVILTNTSNYKGPRLAIEMDRIMSHVLQKIDHWPNYDLFAFVNN